MYVCVISTDYRRIMEDVQHCPFPTYDAHNDQIQRYIRTLHPFLELLKCPQFGHIYLLTRSRYIIVQQFFVH
jgi:hypothetical protein